MINAQMKPYNYYVYADTVDEYGQRKPSTVASGQVVMAINITNQYVQENIAYAGAQYIGLTTANVDDAYVIEFGNLRLKVLYVNPMGRLKQVFMAAM